ALALESRLGSETRNMMLDFGYTPETLIGNMEVIGVDPAKTQALIVSHGHFDHFGGLIDFLKANRSRLPRELTLYVGGEDNFCNRKTASGAPGHFSDWGVLPARGRSAQRQDREVRGADRAARPRVHHWPHPTQELRARAAEHPGVLPQERRRCRLRHAGRGCQGER